LYFFIGIPASLQSEFSLTPAGTKNPGQVSHPQQNGRHGRMHRTLKIEATRPAGSNFLQQQAKFDAFVREFNYERPHELST
jgi:hypothetical protein